MSRRSKLGASQPEQSYMKQNQSLLSADIGHFSLVRAMHVADLITLMNGLFLKIGLTIRGLSLKLTYLGFCGVMSIFSSLRYCLGEPNSFHNVWLGLAFLPLGLFCDILDGRVARWSGKSSLMGQELDSLADLISFGVAPVVLAFVLGLRSYLDTAVLAFFVLCGLTRLARFNVTVSLLSRDATGKSKYFEGTPIPTSLVVDAVMAYWIYKGWVLEKLPLGFWLAGSVLEFHPVVSLFFLHGCLMISKTIRIPKL